MIFLKGQSWRQLKSWYTDGGKEQAIRRCFEDGLKESLVLSLAQANDGRLFIYLLFIFPMPNKRLIKAGAYQSWGQV